MVALATIREQVLLGCAAGETVLINADVMKALIARIGSKEWLAAWSEFQRELREEHHIGCGFNGYSYTAEFFSIKGKR
jgi:hypothetical protein